MLPYLTEHFGNPSSAHSFGRHAREALDEAHERLAGRLHADPRELVLTSGGTEANNLALKGAAWAGKGRGHRIVTSAIEHHAVGHTLRYLEKFGFEIEELPGRPVRPRRSRRRRAGDHRADDPRVGDARQQRGRHDPADRGDRPARASAARTCCSTSMRSRRHRTWTSTSPRSARTSSRSVPTSSRARRGSGRSGCARGPTSSRSSTVAARSAIAGRARRTSPRRSGWRSHTTSPARSGPRPRSGSASSANASRRRCSRSTVWRSPAIPPIACRDCSR